MADVKEDDGASKSNSSPKEYTTPMILTPATVSITSKDEGNTMVVPEIDQEHNKQEDSTNVETNETQAIKEDAIIQKNKEKIEEHIKVENLGVNLKGKVRKPRKRNRNKVAKKTSEIVVSNSGLMIEETHRGVFVKEAEEKTEEKNNGDKLPESSNKRRRKLRRIRAKKAAIKGSDMVVVANNGLMIEEAHKGVSVKETEEKTEEKSNGDKLAESSNKRRRKLRRNKAKKVAPKGSDMVVVGEDKPESSNKKKGLKKVDTMGMVFMCSSKTKADCFQYKILGLPAGKKDQVAKIYKGMRLFLFDVDLRLMYGIFKAVGEGGYNIEPKAFKSAFPAQVRFTVMEDCLPLAEENFRKIIKENYYSRNKFNCQLNSQQVKKLCKVFVAGKIGPNPKLTTKSRQIRADAYTARDRKQQKRRPHPREQTRYHEYGGPPVRYQQEEVHDPSPVRHVARYPPQEVGSYGYERTYPYARDPVLEHRPYHVLDTDNHHQLYSREAPLSIYRSDVSGYDPSGDQMVEYHHHQPPAAAAAAAMFPSQYRLVSREYPHHISGEGLQVHGYGDVGQYFSSSAAQTRYGY